MQWHGVRPNHFTFVNVISACVSIESGLDMGKHFHYEMLHMGFTSNSFINNAVMDMYTKLGSLDDALETFARMPVRDIVSWNTIIMGLASKGYGEKAFRCYQQMQGEGLGPDHITFIGILDACICLKSLEHGKMIHLQVVEKGLDQNVFVGSALVNMYAKCGSLENAEKVFKSMHEKNVVSWSIMISAYAKDGHGRKALELFLEMRELGIQPNEITYVAVLNACAGLSDLRKGKLIHKQIADSQFEKNLFVGSTLIDMYAKCADCIQARSVFNGMPVRNVVCWNSMIAAYSMHGDVEEACQLFGQLQMEAVSLEEATLISVLSVCSHVGLVDQGIYYICSIQDQADLELSGEHYGCVVDLLSRGQKVEEIEFPPQLSISSDALREPQKH